MKNIIGLMVLMFIFICSSHSQNVYSKQSFERATEQELKANFTKARKLKKTGAKITVAGISSTVVGFAMLYYGGESVFYPGFPMFVGGIGATIIGIPILITGASRVNRINELISINNLKLDFKPDTQYNLITQNYQPALTLKITF